MILKIVLSSMKGVVITGLIVLYALVLNTPLPAMTEAGTIVFVGTTSATGLNASYPLSFTSLQGGVGNKVIAKDLILLVTAVANTSDNAFTPPAGFNEIADLYANDNNDANLAVNFVVASSVPTTGTICPASNAATAGSTCFAMVFRGVDPQMPIDVSTTTRLASAFGPNNNDDIDCLATTASTTASLFVCLGAAAGSSWNGAVTWPSGWVQAASSSRGAASNAGLITALGIFSSTTATAGEIGNPPAFAYTLGTSAQDSWAAVGLSLRPDQSRKMRLFTGYTVKIISGTIKLFQR